MATIINSDMIPFKERGMYQACQNVLHGFGSICGASLGGVIADHIGWRWCFLCQVPVSAFALTVGHFVIKKDEISVATDEEYPSLAKPSSKWEQIDLSGAILLVLGLSAQLAAMSMGGNNYPWDDIRVIAAMILSLILLIVFVLVELWTRAIPVMPMSMLKGTLAASNLISNVCVGMAAYSVSGRTPSLQANLMTWTVPFHHSPVFPSRPSRHSIRSWHASCDTIPSNSSRRACFGYHYVSLGLSQRARSSRLSPYDGRKWSRGLFEV